MLDGFARSSSISCRTTEVNMTVVKDAPHARFCELAILVRPMVTRRMAHHQRNITHSKERAKSEKELGKGGPFPLSPEFEYAGCNRSAGRPGKGR
jgi:hypothetical protein